MREAYPQKRVAKLLDRMVLKATALNPEDRYESVEQLRQDIENYVLGYKTSVDRAGQVSKLILFMKRHRREVRIGIGALAALILMCGLAYIALEQKSTEVTHYKNETEELGEQLAGVQGENTVLQEQAEKIERLSADISGLFEYDGNSFWNVNPLPVVGKEIEFSKRILNAYPADGAVREKLFFLYCIQSNFVEALKVSAEGFGPEAMRLRKLILHYPDYQYDGKTRPHGEKLMRFLPFSYFWIC